MGKFIISRSAAGDRFCLQSDIGHTLAVSRDYATLDACKKGIASLILNAPIIPVLDATAGEYGPNPKFEIVADEGGYTFLMKSANGKSVITSTAYATKKACLRAIAMLRRGVAEYEILFHTKEGLTPLKMKMPAHLAPKKTKPAATVVSDIPAKEAASIAPVTALPEEMPPVFDALTELSPLDSEETPCEVCVEEAPAVICEEESESTAAPAPQIEAVPTAAAEPAPAVAAPAPKPAPRLIRLAPVSQEKETANVRAQGKNTAEPAKKRHSVLQKLFKR